MMSVDKNAVAVYGCDACIKLVQQPICFVVPDENCYHVNATT